VNQKRQPPKYAEKERGICPNGSPLVELILLESGGRTSGVRFSAGPSARSSFPGLRSHRRWLPSFTWIVIYYDACRILRARHRRTLYDITPAKTSTFPTSQDEPRTIRMARSRGPSRMAVGSTCHPLLTLVPRFCDTGRFFALFILARSQVAPHHPFGKAWGFIPVLASYYIQRPE